MGSLEARTEQFGTIVRDILKQFQQFQDVASGSQHANLGHQDMRVVEYLGEGGPQMMRALAEHLGLAVNSVTAVVDGLEKRGLAHRIRSETDRRVINVALTSMGEEAHAYVAQAKFQFHRALLSALNEDEQEILLVLFRKIAREGSRQVEQFSVNRTA